MIRDPDPLWVYGLAWWPDGSQLAFNGEKYDETQVDVRGVFVIDADGSEPQQLTNNGIYPTDFDCCSLAWSPDCSRIAFLRSGAGDVPGGLFSGPTSLFTVAADGSHEQRIEGVYVEEFGTFAWNPVG